MYASIFNKSLRTSNFQIAGKLQGSCQFPKKVIGREVELLSYLHTFCCFEALQKDSFQSIVPISK